MDNLNTTPTKDELDIMRDELASLRSSLESQKIVSNSLLRRIMKGNASWLNRFFKYEIFLIFPLATLLFLIIKVAFGTSWLFFSATMLMFVLDLYWDYHVVRLPASDFAELSLLEVRRKILRQMHGRKIQMLVEVPLVCLWACWFAFELIQGTGVAEFAGGVVWAIAVAIGLIIGLIAVFYLYREFDRRSGAILEQIKMLEED